MLKGCWWSGTHLEPFHGVGQLWRREAISSMLIFLCESAVFPLFKGHFSSILFTLLPMLPAASDFQPAQDWNGPFALSIHLPLSALASTSYLYLPVSPHILVQIQEVEFNWCRSSFLSQASSQVV